MSRISRLVWLWLLALALASGQGNSGNSNGKGPKKLKLPVSPGAGVAVDPQDPLARDLVMLLAFSECGGAKARNAAPGYNGTNDGAIAGSPTWIQTPTGCGVRFAGNDDNQKITFPLSPWASGSAVRTTSVMFRMTSNTGSLNTFLSYGVSLDAGTFWNMSYDASAGRLYLHLRDVDKYIPWTFDTKWHMFSAVNPNGASNTNIKLYLDGVEIASTAVGDRSLATVFINPGTAGEMMLGRWGLTSNDSNCHCEIGGAWMWNRVVSPVEESQHFQSPFSMVADGTKVVWSSPVKPPYLRVANQPQIVH